MTRVRWAVARVLHRLGLPYWHVTPRWTQDEIDAIRAKAKQRAARAREIFK